MPATESQETPQPAFISHLISRRRPDHYWRMSKVQHRPIPSRHSLRLRLRQPGQYRAGNCSDGPYIPTPHSTPKVHSQLLQIPPLQGVQSRWERCTHFHFLRAQQSLLGWLAVGGSARGPSRSATLGSSLSSFVTWTWADIPLKKLASVTDTQYAGGWLAGGGLLEAQLVSQ